MAAGGRCRSATKSSELLIHPKYIRQIVTVDIPYEPGFSRSGHQIREQPSEAVISPGRNWS